MGNTQQIRRIEQAQLNQSYETQLVKKIQSTNSVDHKNKILFGIFKTEYYNLCNKWNNGTTSEADFNFLSLYVSKVH